MGQFGRDKGQPVGGDTAHIDGAGYRCDLSELRWRQGDWRQERLWQCGRGQDSRRRPVRGARWQRVQEYGWKLAEIRQRLVVLREQADTSKLGAESAIRPGAPRSRDRRHRRCEAKERNQSTRGRGHSEVQRAGRTAKSAELSAATTRRNADGAKHVDPAKESGRSTTAPDAL